MRLSPAEIAAVMEAEVVAKGEPEPPRRIAPGEPLTSLLARKR